MVEIGPGLGALTKPLANTVQQLHVIELDRDLASGLRAALDPRRVTVHNMDVLEFDFSSLGRRLRIVGNLPYNISTPVLFHLAASAALLRDIHVMLQKEVVDRMVAPADSPEYGRLSVMLQYRFEMERVVDRCSSRSEPHGRPGGRRRLVLATGHERIFATSQDPPQFTEWLAGGGGFPGTGDRSRQAGTGIECCGLRPGSQLPLGPRDEARRRVRRVKARGPRNLQRLSLIYAERTRFCSRPGLPRKQSPSCRASSDRLRA
jgi:hypothetical protein